MLYLPVELALAAIGVIVGLTCDSIALLAAMVYSIANLLVLVRPRRPGLGDDYASLAVAGFLAWAGVSLIIQGASQHAQGFNQHTIAVLTALCLSIIKLWLLKSKSSSALSRLKDHYISDLGVLSIVLIGYVASLEATATIIIGVLVLHEAVELIAEAIQEVASHLKRSRVPPS